MFTDRSAIFPPVISCFLAFLHLLSTFGGTRQAAFGNWGKNELHLAYHRCKTGSDNNRPNSLPKSALHKPAKSACQGNTPLTWLWLQCNRGKPLTQAPRRTQYSPQQQFEAAWWSLWWFERRVEVAVHSLEVAAHTPVVGSLEVEDSPVAVDKQVGQAEDSLLQLAPADTVVAYLDPPWWILRSIAAAAKVVRNKNLISAFRCLKSSSQANSKDWFNPLICSVRS